MTTLPREAAAMPAGTSLEILAPYLPYGIEVEIIEPYGFSGERYQLWGVDMRREFPVLCNNDEQQTEYAFFGLLPVLRPFSQLCEPLADGTVPALVLAAIAVPEVKCVRAEILNAGFGQYHCVCFGEQGQHYYAIHRNNFESVRSSKVKNRLDGQLTDKLREMHFALPVNGRPLIEGVDYIAKAPAAPLTIQEGKSDE